MIWLQVVLPIAGLFVGFLIGKAAARPRSDELRDAEAAAFKRGELAAWQEATQRLRTAGSAS